METRDQWYKPNLLYNIHYRPPKGSQPLKKSDLPQNPPKLVVDTIRFNPSVCTCGEHGCQPQYRMERKVRWVNEEVNTAASEQKDEANKKEIEGRYDCKNGAFDESDGRCDGKVKDVEGECRCDGSVDGDDGDGRCDGRVDGQESNGRCDGGVEGDESDYIYDGRAGDDENVIDLMVTKAMEDAMAKLMVIKVMEDAMAELMMTKGMVDVDVDEYDGRCDGRVGGEENEGRCEGEVNGYEGDGICNDTVDSDKGDDIRFGRTDGDKGGVRNYGSGNGDGSDSTCDDSVHRNAGDGSRDGGAGVDDDDRLDGTVGGHVDECNYAGRLDAVEVDGRCNDMADSRSCDDNNVARSDPHRSDTNDVWIDDTEDIAQAFGIMSIYCNSELHNWGRLEEMDEKES